MELPTKDQVSAYMKAMRAKVKPENCRRSLEVLRRAQAASVAKRLKKKAENAAKNVGV